MHLMADTAFANQTPSRPEFTVAGGQLPSVVASPGAERSEAERSEVERSPAPGEATTAPDPEVVATRARPGMSPSHLPTVRPSALLNSLGSYWSCLLYTSDD